jgi:hypothetical protein
VSIFVASSEVLLFLLPRTASSTCYCFFHFPLLLPLPENQRVRSTTSGRLGEGDDGEDVENHNPRLSAMEKAVQGVNANDFFFEAMTNWSIIQNKPIYVQRREILASAMRTDAKEFCSTQLPAHVDSNHDQYQPIATAVMALNEEEQQELFIEIGEAFTRAQDDALRGQQSRLPLSLPLAHSLPETALLSSSADNLIGSKPGGCSSRGDRGCR